MNASDHDYQSGHESHEQRILSRSEATFNPCISVDISSSSVLLFIVVRWEAMSTTSRSASKHAYTTTGSSCRDLNQNSPALSVHLYLNILLCCMQTGRSTAAAFEQKRMLERLHSQVDAMRDRLDEVGKDRTALRQEVSPLHSGLVRLCIHLGRKWSQLCAAQPWSAGCCVVSSSAPGQAHGQIGSLTKSHG